nr:ORF27 [Darna trima granulovirus]
MSAGRTLFICLCYRVDMENSQKEMYNDLNEDQPISFNNNLEALTENDIGEPLILEIQPDIFNILNEENENLEENTTSVTTNENDMVQENVEISHENKNVCVTTEVVLSNDDKDKLLLCYQNLDDEIANYKNNIKTMEETIISNRNNYEKHINLLTNKRNKYKKQKEQLIERLFEIKKEKDQLLIDNKNLTDERQQLQETVLELQEKLLIKRNGNFETILDHQIMRFKNKLLKKYNESEIAKDVQIEQLTKALHSSKQCVNEVNSKLIQALKTISYYEKNIKKRKEIIRRNSISSAASIDSS